MLSMASLSVNANELLERKLSTLEILPSTEPLLNSEDVAISFIDTGTIKNKAGLIARGPHTVTFTLDENADYPLTVNETVVQPGQSFSMDVNLSKTNHRLLMPVYSAAANASGDAPYDIEIDNLNVDACYASYDEKSESCFKVDYKSVNYHCPADFNFRDGTKDCRKVDIIPLNLDCPSGMSQSGDTCSQVLEGPVELSCDEDEYAVENGKCVKRTFHDTLPCPENGELTSGGQCRVTESSKPVDSPCPETYLNTGYQCEKITSVEPVSTATCPDNMVEHEGQCYFEDGTGSEVSDGNYTRIDETPYVFELQSSNYTVIDSNQTCPDNYPNEHGFSSEKGGVICLSNSAAELPFNIQAESCSGGYIQVDGESGLQCLKESTVIEKSAQCLSDQTFNAETGKCEGIDIKPYGDYCGENRTTAGQCNTYSHEPQDIYCEAGLSYNASKGSCEKVEQKAAAKSCQSGFSLNGAKTRCVKTVSAKLKVSCDSGYTRSSNGRYCYREYSQAANRYCDSGWSLSGEDCKKEESSGVDSCPSGYTKRNGNCHRVVPKSESCASGYQNGGNGTCYKEEEIAASKSCKSGYEMDGTTCKYFDTQDVVSCPSGMTLRNGSCHKIVSKTYSCKWYQKRDGNKCINFNGVGYQANSKYGEDGNASGGSPKYTVGDYSTYDPVTGEVVWTIPAMTATNTGGGGGGGGGTGGMIEREQIQRIAPETRRYLVAPLQTNSYQYCGGGWLLNGDSCKRREEPNYRHCNHVSGGVLRSGTPPAEAKWRVSWGKSIDQHKYWCESKVNASYGCPSGSSSLNSTQCYKNNSDPSKGYCSSGYSLNTSTGNCEKELSEPVTYSCSSGWSLSGSRCERTLTDSVNYYCRSNYSHLSSASCYQDGATSSVGRCPDSYSLNTNNGNCERTLSKTAYAKCPSGSEWTLDGTQCRYYNERSVNISCPDSYSESGSECRKNLIVNPILSCDAGFKLNRATERCERTISTPKL